MARVYFSDKRIRNYAISRNCSPEIHSDFLFSRFILAAVFQQDKYILKTGHISEQLKERETEWQK